MRAVVLRGGELTVRETADPIAGQGDLLLKTLSTAICASDVHFMDNPEARNRRSDGAVVVRRRSRHRHGSRVRRRGHRPRARVQRRLPDRCAGDVDADPIGRRWRRWLADHRTASRGARKFRGTTGRPRGGSEGRGGRRIQRRHRRRRLLRGRRVLCARRQCAAR